ncbi:MAG: hypothetical protein A3F41_01225 [Coxiella sp. RIFCSPHIGHO2_12_FULL_44_14]|nr:MAG: hypothetical protein A3F41_01225 [Coxiella sp. RIFCSPHIGHO2_12_FULL_44_14]
MRIHPQPGTVALTFDDGPSPKYTQPILDILDRYHIQATFFVMGAFAKKYPHLIQEIRRRGHVIANHTMTHPYLTRMYGHSLYYQIVEPNRIVQSITGNIPVCLRPPFGLTNSRVNEFIRSQGMRTVMWDLNTFDYNRQSVDHLIQWVLTHTKPGYDLLMHDGSGNSFQTVKALPAIIEGLRKRGMRFDVICQSTT